jgi:hypothetical protein
MISSHPRQSGDYRRSSARQGSSPDWRGRAGLLALAAACAGACQVGSRDRICHVTGAQARHACVHAGEGPFGVLDGTAAGAVSAVHTAYTVKLAAHGTRQFQGKLSFRPDRAGCWAFFASEGLEIVARTSCGQLVLATAPVDTCEQWRSAFTAALKPNDEVELSLRAPSSAAMLLVERTGEHPGEAWPDQDAATCVVVPADASVPKPADAPRPDLREVPPTTDPIPAMCRSEGPCTRDDECCDYCHDGDHCH